MILTRNNRGDKGFTLVEMAIVLAIIGLLIGGVLTGQDLIHAAKIRAQIQQFSDFSTASAAFQTKFDALPGDWTNSNNDTNFILPASDSGTRNNGFGTGDGNGLIQCTASGNPTGGGGETFMFWADLSDAGYIGFNPSGTTAANLTSAVTINDFLPTSKISDGSTIAVYYLNGAHWFNLSNYSGVTSSAYTSTGSGLAITPEDAYEIDSKMDDGYPNTGTVVASSYTTSTAVTSTPSASSTGAYCIVEAGSVAASTNPYNVTSVNAACSIQVRM